jgi:hypothetical protein
MARLNWEASKSVLPARPVLSGIGVVAVDADQTDKAVADDMAIYRQFTSPVDFF